MRKTRIGVAFLLVIFLTLFASISHADEVSQVRAAIVSKQAQWQAGETSMTRLSPAERVARLGLVKPAMLPAAAEMLPAEPPLVGAPPSLDWRSNGGNFVTPIRNQGGCGSCWAFAATAALESLTLRVNNTPGVDLNLSEQVLVSCGGAGSCGGGYIGYASDYIRNTGLPLETCYPYTATDGSCGSACSSYNTATYRIQSWSWVTTTSPTVNAIRDALVSYGPLVTTLDVYNDFFSYSSGVYTHTTGDYAGGHAVLIVGYNDAGQYFIVKNSWGAGWGELGYFKIAYSELNSIVDFGDWTIAYTGSVCSYSISPASQSFSASGGTGTVSVATQAGCTWSVSNSTSWITITAGSSGTGSGNVTYTVASNSGSGSRSAVLTTAGQTITINQSGQGSSAIYNSQDFNSDGKPDILMQNVNTGQVAAWFMNGTTFVSDAVVSQVTNYAGGWRIVGTADFNGDSKPDILMQNINTGQVAVWFMDGTHYVSDTVLSRVTNYAGGWRIVGTADFNGDSKPDILMQNINTGQVAVWFMNGTTFVSDAVVSQVTNYAGGWRIVGTADFNGDSKPDILMQNINTGQVAVWFMDGTHYVSYTVFSRVMNYPGGWRIVETADFNADTKPDILMQNVNTGQLAIWFMDGATYVSDTVLSQVTNYAAGWRIVGPR